MTAFGQKQTFYAVLTGAAPRIHKCPAVLQCNGHTLKMIARAKEPWLLAYSSSLSSLSGAEIVTLYARRMQIEQSFRDLKSHRYGCAFEDMLTRHPRRLEMLLLLHALASVAA